VLLTTVNIFGQFKDTGLETTSVIDGIVSPHSSFLFGFQNSDDFLMRHSFNMSYSSFAGQGMSLTSYTNSMFYKLMTNMNVQMDVSFLYSPYSTLGEQFQKDVSGIYISNAAVNYYPWKNFSVHLQYRSMPFGYGYYNPFYGYSSPFNYSSDEFDMNPVEPVDLK
jgi:hypothetical protein